MTADESARDAARLSVAREQLARMRGMNAAYHARFFSDIRFSVVVGLVVLASGFAIDERLFLALPVVALMGACQTAFDASYLIFSRQFATRLEQWINASLGRDILVAHRLEDAYLFPLDRSKVVTLSLAPGAFSWFGFMTAFYTLTGIGLYVTGIVLSLDAVRVLLPRQWGAAYVVSLVLVTAFALAVGVWWFPGGEGERRLRAVLDEAFPATGSPSIAVDASDHRSGSTVG